MRRGPSSLRCRLERSRGGDRLVGKLASGLLCLSMEVCRSCSAGGDKRGLRRRG